MELVYPTAHKLHIHHRRPQIIKILERSVGYTVLAVVQVVAIRCW